MSRGKAMAFVADLATLACAFLFMTRIVLNVLAHKASAGSPRHFGWFFGTIESLPFWPTVIVAFAATVFFAVLRVRVVRTRRTN